MFEAVRAAFAGTASREDRIALVEAALRMAGPAGREEIGRWVTTIVPAEVLVPETARRWRPLVHDAMQFVVCHICDRRLAARIVEQMELAPDTPPEIRLLRLISKTPGLQKIGQVLARNRRLAPPLRKALIELENGMSDVTPQEIRGVLTGRLPEQLDRYAVKIDSPIFSEASVSAVVRFTWQNPGRERERGVFKVLKPYVPACFTEDIAILQQLGEYLAAQDRGYAFALRDIKDMFAEVRVLLEHELDFAREQMMLGEARRIYRSSFGIRVPRLIRPLCAAGITAMSEEAGIKVTDAFPRSPIRRIRAGEQLVEALVAVPLFTREENAIFHGDPHAGNLLYDEPNRELVVLDWALAERMTLTLRRQLVLLALMMMLRNPDGVTRAIVALSRPRGERQERRILRRVADFFGQLPRGASPSTLDAMILLDDLAIEGIRFPAPLFLFRKMLFTLDGVLEDIAGPDLRMDQIIARDFLTRWLSSFGLFYSPLTLADFAAIEWQALLYPLRAYQRCC
ncbi:MAG TPA: AarF/UbiB family protein [Bryobacteraceae bacterium]|nr:AarF/UbiB family protein [Bryobacteraceae bacterium]